jgi:hypothetical protein
MRFSLAAALFHQKGVIPNSRSECALFPAREQGGGIGSAAASVRTETLRSMSGVKLALRIRIKAFMATSELASHWLKNCDSRLFKPKAQPYLSGNCHLIAANSP